uniref:ENTH domain-containing protein n=1 Tax=Kwoniella pini CBS 10737 TaxID=1296096 RepID=A0A1B9I1H4_9TREE|nr:uncharacterized protein I206_05085 [Kwoniella pini CBS 10737]OCF49392.1 hypothetical protein I206_05085 [Kwoniella pini CBS 10737]
MSHNLDKIVKLACKPKNAPPKAKYIEVLIAATYSEDGSLQDIIRSLSLRLREANGAVVFKALLTIHQMLRSGATDNFLNLLSQQDMMKLRNIQGQNWEGFQPPASMSAYAAYLDSRIRSYKELKHDVVNQQTESNRKSDGQSANSKARKLRHLSVEKGLLREVKHVQKILDSLTQCRFYDDDLRDENTVLAFRMLVKDLLVLFQAGNEGVCNILEHYFEMSKVDATESFDIYKSFIKQTDRVVDYLGVAKKLNHVVNVPVPNLKHAPTGLVKALEEYLNDPNFENNRMEYKKSLGVVEGRKSPPQSKPATSSSVSSAPPPAAAPSSPPPASAPSGASQKMQDFFDSIQSDQQPTMFGGPAQQINYNQMTMHGGQFNPFRQSMMMPQATGFGQMGMGMQPQITGFMPQQQPQGQLQPQQTGIMAFGGSGINQTQRQSMFPQMTGQPFMQPQQTGFVQPQLQQQQQQQQQQSTPFAHPQPQQPQQTGFLQPQSTGANPFRQSMMLNTNVTGAMSQPSSPFGHHQPSSPFQTQNQTTGVNGFGQIQRPGSTPAFSTTSPGPKPLTAQATGSKNPFAPAGGVPPPVPQVPKGPSMNELLMGGVNSQPTGGMSSPWSQQNGQQQPNQQHNGGGMSDIASAFSFENANKPKQDDFSSQFGSLSTNTGASSPSTTNPTSSSAFGSISSQPTGMTSLSSNPTGSTQGFLQPQQTGYGGSTIKPFKPTSTFGSSLLESLPPIQEPGSTPTKSPSNLSGIQNQSTGFPFSGAQSNGNQGLSPQMTGAPNPFRQSMFGSLGPNSTGQGQGQGQGMNSQITGFGTIGGGAFGIGSPFAGQNVPQQQQQQQQQRQGMNQFGMFGNAGQQGQGQGQNQQGSLI